MLLEIECKNCGNEDFCIYRESESITIRCDGCSNEFTVETKVRQERISTRINEKAEITSETKEGASGKVYFVSGSDDCPIKIGYTSGKIEDRIKIIQTGYPYKLSVFGFIDGSYQIENALHTVFKPLRMRGEWFQRTPSLINALSAIKGVYDDKIC